MMLQIVDLLQDILVDYLIIPKYVQTIATSTGQILFLTHSAVKAAVENQLVWPLLSL